MVTMRLTGLFFDAPVVQRAMDKSTRQALSKGGAFIRQTAKTSIRKRKGVSKPGQAPHSHAGHLRRLLFFAYDLATASVVIGPARFRDGEAPNLLEKGGTVVRKRSKARGGGRVRMVYRARPFMGPAMDKELPNLPKRWHNTIRG